MKNLSMDAIEVLEAQIDDKPVVRQLLELYLREFSEYTDDDADPHGHFGYRYLDHYWTAPERRPFLFRVGGRWAGLLLVRVGTPHDMAEFFVMRKYRRHGVGMTAAREIFARFPGEWQVRQMAANATATTFWRGAIPVEFEQELTNTGPVQRFSVGRDA